MTKKKKSQRIKIKHMIIIIVLLIIFLLILAYAGINGREKTELEEQEKLVRPPAVAGTWYPSDKALLKSLINDYLRRATKKEINGEIRALIAPHAGYPYSGLVAANGFKQLEKDYDTVILIGPTHHYPFIGASIPNYTHYSTPLGEVRVSSKAKEMLKENLINTVLPAHTKEHCLEAELPFLQVVLGDFEIIPIITGRVSPEELASTIMKYIDDKTLIVVSSDLSHYHPYTEAVSLDKKCNDNIPALNIEAVKTMCEACGKTGILTLMHIAKAKGWKGMLIDYKNSGDVTGDKSRGVVGYSAIVFYEETLSAKEKEYLLSLARNTLKAYLSTGRKPEVNDEELTPNLRKVQGCFVTLNKNHRLRGCIGHILPQEELYKCVIDNAVNAAVNDKRFKPVVYDELRDIQVEISVLTVPEELRYDSPNDLLGKLRPSIDGVVLKKGWHQATYLPQVWEQIPEKQSFLANLCVKAGLSPECWQDPELKVYTYQALVFGEE